MAKELKPDFSCKTNDQPNSVVDAPCKKACKVTYRFIFRSNLSMPYAVAVNGKVLAAFKDRPKRTDSKIPLVVDVGQSVELYLNSDAHPAHRKSPVYKVTVGDDDVEVVITEVEGKLTCLDTPELSKSKTDDATGRTVQHMTAKLTGDIWMKVSHKYAPNEVDALLPPKTSAEVTAAVKSIYSGLGTPTLKIQQPAAGSQSERALSIEFIDSKNPKENITSYTLLKDGLPRVHPAGYAALFSAALEHGIATLQVTSCWRPMLGSIAHRAGLGLDVGYVGATPMNRQELRLGKSKDTANVSDDEVELFKEYEAAIVADKKADAELSAAKKAASTPGLTAEQKLQANKDLQSAADKKSESQKVKVKASKAWNDERDATEPVKVKLFRTSLLQCSCVSQLFDPWVMDANTKDGLEPEPNMQRPLPPGKKGSSNEELHAHHLHVTVYEPKILQG
ncbi:MAG: hypothetical protein KGL57_04105 [Burkholderiales bacterium]|nr:hypothetical protein [Burkholderiales bacterium]